MICKDCPAGKKIMRNGHRCVRCIVYGMILKEDHECDREGWKNYEPDDQSDDGEGNAEIPENSGGAAGGMPELLPEPEA